MNRNQIIVLSACAGLCIGIYLFASTKKPASVAEKPVAAQSDGSSHEQAESLDIEQYLTTTNAQMDKTTRDRVEKLIAAKSYRELIGEYQKLDKPIAVAYFTVQLATQENKAESYARAGDYNAMLMQTAPDEKAHNFLSNNILECYQKAAELDTTNIEYKIRLAGAYMENGGQPMQGVGILLDIVKKDSNNVEAQLMLGRFGIVSGQFDKAIVRLEKIIYLQPLNSEALLLLAEAYNGKGNSNKAIELLEKCKRTLTDPQAKKQVDEYIQKIKKPNS